MVVEGEKAARAAEKRIFPAAFALTTSLPGGSKAAGKADWPAEWSACHDCSTDVDVRPAMPRRGGGCPDGRRGAGAALGAHRGHADGLLPQDADLADDLP